MRVLIDPNVLFSALIAPGGASDQAVRAAVIHATVVVSPHLIQRFLRRAAHDRFRRWFTIIDAQELIDQLSDVAFVVDDPARSPSVVTQDPSDDYLVAVARAGDADRLLTGDKGIRSALEHAADLTVVSPAELLNELGG